MVYETELKEDKDEAKRRLRLVISLFESQGGIEEFYGGTSGSSSTSTMGIGFEQMQLRAIFDVSLAAATEHLTFEKLTDKSVKTLSHISGSGVDKDSAGRVQRDHDVTSELIVAMTAPSKFLRTSWEASASGRTITPPGKLDANVRSLDLVNP